MQYKSQKINFKKPVTMIWIVIVAICAVVVLSTAIKYKGYKDGQDYAIEVLLLISDEYDEYKDNRAEMVRKMYKNYHPTGLWGYDNSDLYDAADKADRALADVLEEAGFDCYEGSYYFEHTNYFSYTWNKSAMLIVVVASIAAVFAAINALYLLDKKNELILDGDKVICKKGGKVLKEFFAKDIVSVESASLKGLRILGNGGIKYKINLIENADELKNTIVAIMQNR